MAYEIYTYGGGETLWYVFNAVVTMMSGGNYITLIKIAGISALFWVIAQGIFKGGATSLTFLLVYILVYGIMFVPKVNVVIVDRVVAEYSGRVVANVPWGLGFFAHMTSKIGDSITRTTESTFALPNGAKYAENGMLFNSYIIEAASQWVITNETFASNMQEFMKQCVFYDILLRKYTWQQLTTSKDIWKFIGTTSPSPVRGFLYTNINPVRKNYASCLIGYQALTTAWQAEIKNANEVYGQRLYPHLTMATAVSRMLSDTPAAYSYLMKFSAAGADIVRQNLMINVTRRSIRATATGANATASVTDFAQVQAEATLKVNQDTAGRMAAKILPLTKNILEAVIYATFPFVLLMMLLPVGGGVFITYIMTLLWIQMWAPLYAVLNLFMELYAEDRMTAVSNIGGGTGTGPSIATNTGILSVASDTASIAGYLSMSIPIIAWMLVSGGKFAASQVASAVIGAAGGAANQAAPGAASGNIKLGELGAYNTSMFQNRTSPTSDSMQGTMHRANGQVHNMFAGGGIKTMDPISSRFHQFTRTKQSNWSQNKEVGQATQKTEQSASNLARTLNSAFTSSNAFGNMYKKSTDYGRGISIDKNSSESRFRQTSQEMTAILEKSMGVSNARKASRTISMMLGVNGDRGGKRERGSKSFRNMMLKTITGGKAGADIKWSSVNMDEAKTALNDAIRYGSKNNIGHEWRQATGYSDKAGFTRGWGQTEGSSDEARAALGNIRQASSQYSKSVSTLENVKDSAMKSHAQGAGSTENVTDEVYKELGRRGITISRDMPRAKADHIRSLLNKHDFNYDKVAEEYNQNQEQPSSVRSEVNKVHHQKTHASLNKQGNQAVNKQQHQAELATRLHNKKYAQSVYNDGSQTREAVANKRKAGEKLENSKKNGVTNTRDNINNGKATLNRDKNDVKKQVAEGLHTGKVVHKKGPDPRASKGVSVKMTSSQVWKDKQAQEAKKEAAIWSTEDGVNTDNNRQGASAPESNQSSRTSRMAEARRQAKIYENHDRPDMADKVIYEASKEVTNQPAPGSVTQSSNEHAPGSSEPIKVNKNPDYESTRKLGNQMNQQIKALKAKLNKSRSGNRIGGRNRKGRGDGGNNT